MQILSLEHHAEVCSRLRCALELTGKPYELSEFSGLNEMPGNLDLSGFRLAIIGTQQIDSALASIVFLRGRLPSGHIIAHGEFNALDRTTPARIRAAGADVVLDSRFTPSKMALIIDRFLWNAHQQATGTPEIFPEWLLRKTMARLAPAAISD